MPVRACVRARVCMLSSPDKHKITCDDDRAPAHPLAAARRRDITHMARARTHTHNVCVQSWSAAACGSGAAAAAAAVRFMLCELVNKRLRAGGHFGAY